MTYTTKEKRNAKDRERHRTDPRAAEKRAARRAYYAANKERENAMARARHQKNREKNLAQQRVWRERNPGSWRKQRGLPEPTRPQPLLCECCEKRIATHLDHDHKTGRFRGWLCGNCNRGIGQLGDDIHGLQRAMGYLTRIYDEATGREVHNV
jgi:Recombination endonuclease VII